MEHLGQKFYIGSTGRVLLSELKFEFEETSLPCGSLWTLDEGTPIVEISFGRRGVDGLVLLLGEFLEVSDESFFCRVAHKKCNK